MGLRGGRGKSIYVEKGRTKRRATNGGGGSVAFVRRRDVRGIVCSIF